MWPRPFVKPTGRSSSGRVMGGSLAWVRTGKRAAVRHVATMTLGFSVIVGPLLAERLNSPGARSSAWRHLELLTERAGAGRSTRVA